MIDPPRPGVAEAIRRARMAGIRTVMLTGDQLNTAIAIARELGIGEETLMRFMHAISSDVEQSHLPTLLTPLTSPLRVFLLKRNCELSGSAATSR